MTIFKDKIILKFTSERYIELTYAEYTELEYHFKFKVMPCNCNRDDDLILKETYTDGMNESSSNFGEQP